ncbi:MAG: anthranilate phosphoribosyltransferase [Kiritimatiellia bacterium]
MMEYPKLLKKLIARQDLTESENYAAITAMLRGEMSPGQSGAFLAALAAKGESISEITGGARAMRTAATRVQSLSNDTLDTVGTGGDGGRTFNISTTVSFVAAGAGAIVAKHGNRASSGICGAADCLERLGFNLQVEPEIMEEALNEIGICFLFAPSFHSAMRHCAVIRREMGVRTIFNMLGPLTNPAGATRQLIGVFAPDLTETFASVARQLGAKRVLVVHGHDGMDEITLTTTTRCSELNNGTIKTYDIDPLQWFEELCSPVELEGGAPEVNAEITKQILSAKIQGAKRDIVLLNSAASLLACGMAATIEEGIAQSKESIDSGAALDKLNRLIDYSKS